MERKILWSVLCCISVLVIGCGGDDNSQGDVIKVGPGIIGTWEVLSFDGEPSEVITRYSFKSARAFTVTFRLFSRVRKTVIAVTVIQNGTFTVDGSRYTIETTEQHYDISQNLKDAGITKQDLDDAFEDAPLIQESGTWSVAENRLTLNHDVGGTTELKRIS